MILSDGRLQTVILSEAKNLSASCEVSHPGAVFTHSPVAGVRRAHAHAQNGKVSMEDRRAQMMWCA
jgi:hypothetical protein